MVEHYDNIFSCDKAQFITTTCPCNMKQFLKVEKNDIFRCKNVTLFLIFAQNIDCRYTLEPPR